MSVSFKRSPFRRDLAMEILSGDESWRYSRQSPFCRDECGAGLFAVVRNWFSPSQRIEQRLGGNQRRGRRSPVCRSARRVCRFGSMQCSAVAVAGRERRNQHRSDGGRQNLQHGQSQNQIRQKAGVRFLFENEEI